MKSKHYIKLIVLYLLFLITTENKAQNIVTVTDCNLHGWIKQAQTGTSVSFTNGIATPPLGKGSVLFNSPNIRFVRLRSTSYHNTLLSSLTEFGYSTYVQNRENSLDVNYVVLLIDTNNDGQTDDNLVFDPRYQSQPYVANNFPDQGLSVVGAWQTWNMLTGAWWLGPPPRPDPDQGGAIFTLASYIAQNPNAKIINDANLGGGGIRLTGGAVPPIFAPNFLGNADNFRIGINGVTTVYDFEFTIANAGADKNVIYGYGSNCTTLSGSAAGGVAPYSYSWSPGGSTPNNATTEVCPTTTTTYTLTVTDANGCSRTDDITVFVNDVRCGSKLDKVKVCHQGEEICIAAAAVPAHLKHGDVLGSCDNLTTRSKTFQSEKISLDKIKLYNYPNPAHENTTLQYEIPMDGFITIKLYDINGRELKTVINGFKSSGQHIFNLNTSDLISGIYYYTLKAESSGKIFSKSNKLIILR